MPDSSIPLFLWGAGTKKSLRFPAHASIKVGKDTSMEFVVLQIHYHNPTQRTDILDSSGLSIKMTSHLRKNDIGILFLGTHFDIELPPGLPLYEISGNCSQEWTSSLPTPINIISSGPHAHLTGRAIWTEIWRSGSYVDYFGEPDLVYDFNKQKLIPEFDMVILPGDDIVTHCIYDTTSRTNITYAGYTTEDEMCLNFVLYYPKLDVKACLSNSLAVDMHNPDYRRPRSHAPS